MQLERLNALLQCTWYSRHVTVRLISQHVCLRPCVATVSVVVSCLVCVNALLVVGYLRCACRECRTDLRCKYYYSITFCYYCNSAICSIIASARYIDLSVSLSVARQIPVETAKYIIKLLPLGSHHSSFLRPKLWTTQHVTHWRN